MASASGCHEDSKIQNSAEQGDDDERRDRQQQAGDRGAGREGAQLQGPWPPQPDVGQWPQAGTAIVNPTAPRDEMRPIAAGSKPRSLRMTEMNG